MRPFLFILALLIAFAAPAAAQEKHASPQLLSAVSATGDLGVVPVALKIDLAPGWHAYWRTPGDAGLAPVLDWTGSDNLKSAALRYPAPSRFTTLDLDNFGYHDSVTFPVDVTPQTAGGALALKLKLDLLVCADICVPETHLLTLDIPAGDAAPSDDAADYDAALQKLPASDSGEFIINKIFLDVDSDNKNYLVTEAQAEKPESDADIFIEHKSNITFGKPVISYDAAARLLTLKSVAHSNMPTDQLKTELQNDPVTLTYRSGNLAVEQTVMLSAGVVTPAQIDDKPMTLSDRIRALDIQLILTALLGGLILNLMPCVLPVLSLKVLSVVSHGPAESRVTIFRNFMASAAGILFSFWLLAGGLILLKAAGETVGWGIQFQHPWFLVFLIVVLLVFAANLWGMFDFHMPRFIARYIPARHENRPTLLGHFMTGAFATLLATPCTAPFLGTAVGFALGRGAFEILTIFTFLGIGLALPYMALAVSPGLFRFMPRPGTWMIKLQRVMSVALALTAVWLMSVFYTITTTPALADGWQKFDQSLIAPAVAEGKTVVVDVTAEWCLTCKANKRLVLESAEITEALSAPNIVLLQADWTQPDDAIAAYLKSFGRYGIPFNVVYGPAAPDGIPLPELLSKDAVLEAIAEAAGE